MSVRVSSSGCRSAHWRDAARFGLRTFGPPATLSSPATTRPSRSSPSRVPPGRTRRRSLPSPHSSRRPRQTRSSRQQTMPSALSRGAGCSPSPLHPPVAAAPRSGRHSSVAQTPPAPPRPHGSIPRRSPSRLRRSWKRPGIRFSPTTTSCPSTRRRRRRTPTASATPAAVWRRPTRRFSPTGSGPNVWTPASPTTTRSTTPAARSARAL